MAKSSPLLKYTYGDKASLIISESLKLPFVKSFRKPLIALN